jgi:tRNA dimethylallyltransferase
MPSQTELPPLIILAGPTAVGKTELSVRLAQQIGAEIISADSRLFYRGMDIGTDKPSEADRAAVPHHLIDFLDPDETYSLAEFQAAVIRIADEIRERGRLPLLVGGTGQYVRAIVEGWQIPDQPPDDRLRGVLARMAEEAGAGAVQQWLTILDPAASARIDPRNTRRMVRALEVILSTGRPFSSQRRKGEPPFETFTIGLTRPRPELYERIDRRVEAMLAAGLIEEVAGLLAAGWPPEAPAMTAIGYREAVRYLRGELDRTGMVELMRRRSRVLVRRQANWFKPDDPDIKWIEMGPPALETAAGLVRDFLNGDLPV